MSHAQSQLLPVGITSKPIHSCTRNSTFTLYGTLPNPQPGRVLGIIGASHLIGKSTTIKILSGKLQPNFGDPLELESHAQPQNTAEFKDYFQRILNNELTAVIKPKHIDRIPKKVKAGATVQKILKKKDERNIRKQLLKELDLESARKKEITRLSGSELQRFTLAVCCCRDVDVYSFDQPSYCLSLQQQISAAKMIRDLLSSEEEQRRKQTQRTAPYIMVVDNDLTFLDLVCDAIYVLYGTPNQYGILSGPFGVADGLDVYLSGLDPVQNIRFREFPLNFTKTAHNEPLQQYEMNALLGFGFIRRSFAKSVPVDVMQLVVWWMNKLDNLQCYKYPSMKKTFGAFELNVEGGQFHNGEIIVLLGDSKKTTFLKLIAGILRPDTDTGNQRGFTNYFQSLKVSYKPQKIAPSFSHSVSRLYQKRIPAAFGDSDFIRHVIKPLKVDELYDNIVQDMCDCCGDVHRVGLALALGTPADLYLIDESASKMRMEENMKMAKVIKRFIRKSNKTAFVAVHDMMIASYLADTIIVFRNSTPSTTVIGNHASFTASKPMPWREGINAFLQEMNITVRRDARNGRPRVNKPGCRTDIEQKKAEQYFAFGD